MNESLPQNTQAAPPSPSSALAAGTILPASAVSIPSVPAQQPQATSTPSSGGATFSNGQPIDPSVVAVMTAIKQVETGGSNDPYNQAGDSGSSLGAFQWNNLINGQHVPLQAGQIPANFQAAAVKYGLNPNDFSEQNQNLVAYNQIASYKAEGLTPDSIDALWNGASPDPNSPGQYIHNNSARATAFTNALNGVVQGMSPSATPPVGSLTSAATPAPAAPSVAGFGENAVQSAGNFVGNLINAVVHPIQTVQGIGDAAAGGFQELGGQDNSNTEDFNNVVNYFKQRYGSVSDLANTAYTDPIGLAADLSAVLGIGEGAVGAVGKASEISEAGALGSAADAAEASGIDHIVKPDGTVIPTNSVSNPVTQVTNPLGEALGTASRLTNPLTPVVSGIGGLLGSGGTLASEAASQLTGFEPKTIDAIVANPEEFTPEAIANTTRAGIADQVETALQGKIATLDETSSAYAPIRESDTPIPVAKNFLEDQLRKQAGVDVVDGQIVAKGSSEVRAPKDVAALQSVFDTWKPEFQKGVLTPQEFLNFRQDLAGAAKYDKEFTASEPVEAVASKMRTALNSAYRSKIAGLGDIDDQFSSQVKELTTLRKGFIDKDGNLLESATNKIANSTGAGKDTQLERLEQIVPGISKKLTALKAIEDIQKAGGTKVGTYPSAFLKAGGLIAGAASGNIPLMATSLATMFLASPDVAVPILRAIGANKALISQTLARLAKYATISAVGGRATGSNSLAALQSTEQQDQTSQPAESTASQIP